MNVSYHKGSKHTRMFVREKSQSFNNHENMPKMSFFWLWSDFAEKTGLKTFLKKNIWNYRVLQLQLQKPHVREWSGLFFKKKFCVQRLRVLFLLNDSYGFWPISGVWDLSQALQNLPSTLKLSQALQTSTKHSKPLRSTPNLSQTLHTSSKHSKSLLSSSTCGASFNSCIIN